jgi:K+-transporting ATPase KdpF subunit
MNQKVTLSFMSIAAIPVSSVTAASSSPSGYLIGGIIALLILGYLVYSLIRPEKF